MVLRTGWILGGWRVTTLAAVSVVALAAACSTTSTAQISSAGGGSVTSAAGSGSIAGAVTSGPASNTPKSTYSIGYTNGISGVGASIAKGELNGLNAAFNAANAAGGVNGHQIKLVSLDNNDDPATAASQVTQLVKSNNVLAVTGLVGSPACSPAIKLSASFKVPVICGVADTSALKPVHPYLYTKYGSEVTEAKAMVSVVTDTLKQPKPKLGFVFIDFPSAREWANTVKAAATQAGIESVAFDGITASTVDLSTEAARLQSAGATVVLTQIIAPQVISLSNAFKSQGTNTPIISEATTADYPTLKSLANPNIYQLLLTPLVDPADTRPAVVAYVKALAASGISGYEGINGAELVISYAQGQQLIQAMSKCGDTCTGESLNAALEQVAVDLPGISQNYSYSTDRHYPQTFFTVARYDTAKAAVVNSPTQYAGNPIP